MQCFYINLDKAEIRRNQIEENFSKYKNDGWTLTRFPAFDKSHADVVGSIWDVGKATYLSHKNLIKEHLKDEPILVLEDDAKFGPRTCATIDHFLKENSFSLNWDILFTDIGITNPISLLKLIYLRARIQKIECIGLKDLGFVGATAYIVNPKSKDMLIKLLEGPIDLPFDLKLRDLLLKKEIEAFSFFPFLTTLTDEAEKSQICVRGDFPSQDPDTNLVLAWNLFRKMAWLDRREEDYKAQLDELTKLCDYDILSFMPVLGAMISKNFLLK